MFVPSANGQWRSARRRAARAAENKSRALLHQMARYSDPRTCSHGIYRSVSEAAKHPPNGTTRIAIIGVATQLPYMYSCSPVDGVAVSVEACVGQKCSPLQSELMFAVFPLIGGSGLLPGGGGGDSRRRPPAHQRSGYSIGSFGALTTRQPAPGAWSFQKPSGSLGAWWASSGGAQVSKAVRETLCGCAEQ